MRAGTIFRSRSRLVRVRRSRRSVTCWAAWARAPSVPRHAGAPQRARRQFRCAHRGHWPRCGRATTGPPWMRRPGCAALGGARAPRPPSAWPTRGFARASAVRRPSWPTIIRASDGARRLCTRAAISAEPARTIHPDAVLTRHRQVTGARRRVNSRPVMEAQVHAGERKRRLHPARRAHARIMRGRRMSDAPSAAHCCALPFVSLACESVSCRARA